MTADQLKAKTFDELERIGFRPARWMPLPDLNQTVRPVSEIASRLMALDALFAWVAFPEKAATMDRVKNYIQRNDLVDWLTEEEEGIVSQPRDEARDEHIETVGWKLENMWPLAWVLGFNPEPGLDASQIDEKITQPLFTRFLAGLDGTRDELLARSTPRPAADVIALEYRFYCAHNAVRSAQLGDRTVPKGFDPVLNGGVVHERRHSLSWCVAPGVGWDETDLST